LWLPPTLTHRWLLAALLQGAGDRPWKTGLNWTMPELTKVSEGSLWGRTGEGRRREWGRWGWWARESRNTLRTSAAGYRGAEEWWRWERCWGRVEEWESGEVLGRFGVIEEEREAHV